MSVLTPISPEGIERCLAIACQLSTMSKSCGYTYVKCIRFYLRVLEVAKRYEPDMFNDIKLSWAGSQDTGWYKTWLAATKHQELADARES